MAASAEAANNIDQSSKATQDAQTPAAEAPAAAPAPRPAATGYGMYPYPYGGGYPRPNYYPYPYGGYYPQRTYSIGGLGYQGLPWYGFSNYWRG